MLTSTVHIAAITTLCSSEHFLLHVRSYIVPGLCIQTFVTVHDTKEYRPAEAYDVSRVKVYNTG